MILHNVSDVTTTLKLLWSRLLGSKRQNHMCNESDLSCFIMGNYFEILGMHYINILQITITIIRDTFKRVYRVISIFSSHFLDHVHSCRCQHFSHTLYSHITGGFFLTHIFFTHSISNSLPISLWPYIT